jgi:hypothetical protein
MREKHEEQKCRKEPYEADLLNPARVRWTANRQMANIAQETLKLSLYTIRDGDGFSKPLPPMIYTNQNPMPTRTGGKLTQKSATSLRITI